MVKVPRSHKHIHSSFMVGAGKGGWGGIDQLGLSKRGYLQCLAVMLRNILKRMQLLNELPDLTQKLAKAVQH